MIPAKHLETLQRYYAALASMDMVAWTACHDPGVAYNVHGTTPVSGRWEGVDRVVGDLLPRLFSRLQPGSVRIPVKWRIMVADQRRAAVLFDGESKNLQGDDYNNRYLQIHQFNTSGLIEEVWEFFDSELAMRVVFHQGEQAPMSEIAFKYEE